MRLEQLPAHLAGSALAPVYLIAGAEPLFSIEATDAVRARARELGFDEREILDASATGFDWNELARHGASLSLFAQRRIIELRLPTGKPGKEGSAAIMEWCVRPPADTLLLISTTEWSRKHEGAWVTAIERIGVVLPLWPLAVAQLPAWVRERAAHHKLRLDFDACQMLVARIEGNLLAAAQEVSKLALLAAERAARLGEINPGILRIDAATLDELVADHARFEVFGLADAALAGDGVRALRMLAGLAAEGQHAAELIGGLVYQFGTLLRVAQSVDSGKPIATALRAERLWQSREAGFRAALARGDSDFWEARLAELGRIDAIAKGRGEGVAMRELERWLVRGCVPKSARALAMAAA